VFGDLSGCGFGGFAEYVCAREDALVPKPTSMTFENAAALPQTAVLALQGLRFRGQVQPGQKVLINGAGGGVGTLAVQIAKSYGAEVTGVDSAGKLDMVRELGADHVIDYTKEDFTRNGLLYDLIVDVAAYRSTLDYKRSLGRGGAYGVIGGSTGRILQTLLLGPLISTSEGKNMGLVLHKPNKDLDHMVQLVEAGTVVPIIDRRYPLSDVADALRYFGEGQTKGKLVITLQGET
jgi:NADPH:quinone reductase-like Zn-dependent oxidoreductase